MEIVQHDDLPVSGGHLLQGLLHQVYHFSRLSLAAGRCRRRTDGLHEIAIGIIKRQVGLLPTMSAALLRAQLANCIDEIILSQSAQPPCKTRVVSWHESPDIHECVSVRLLHDVVLAELGSPARADLARQAPSHFGAVRLKQLHESVPIARNRLSNQLCFIHTVASANVTRRSLEGISRSTRFHDAPGFVLVIGSYHSCAASNKRCSGRIVAISRSALCCPALVG